MTWLPIATAPKNGTPIIYLARDQKPMKNPWFIGEAMWRDCDEGVNEGWWDESCNMDVTPKYWMPRPATPDAITCEQCRVELGEYADAMVCKGVNCWAQAKGREMERLCMGASA